MQYRPDLPVVLHDISFEIFAREKVGSVGRTGSGKSSLMQALFRMVEPGRGTAVWIDGVNVLTLCLADLRRALSVIPQDPTLFSGTVRYNLDPTGKSTDADMWRALENVCMSDPINALNGKLDGRVSEGGTNFSVGQRQLICLARAMLKKAKILIMDEATAAVDVETDAIIQRAIRSQFADVTVLTIAHRVHTITDSDRVMVFDSGILAEFDKPSHLLAKPNSLFRKVAHT